MDSRELPHNTAFLTGYKSNSDSSVSLPKRPLPFRSYDDGKMPMTVAYVNKLPADLNQDADLAYDSAMSKAEIGLVSGGGAVLRYVDLAPGYTCMMHRTQSLDYGIVLNGVAECILDSGEVQRMNPGDVMVQRYTKHAWKNPDAQAWTRIVFVLTSCEPLQQGGQPLGEDLGRGAAFLPPSKE